MLGSQAPSLQLGCGMGTGVRAGSDKHWLGGWLGGSRLVASWLGQPQGRGPHWMAVACSIVGGCRSRSCASCYFRADGNSLSLHGLCCSRRVSI